MLSDCKNGRLYEMVTTSQVRQNILKAAEMILVLKETQPELFVIVV